MHKYFEVEVFIHFPFYFEMKSGKSRYLWGHDSPLGNFLKNKYSEEWGAAYRKSIETYTNFSIIIGWNPVSFDHHCPGYDTILSKGICNIIEDAQKRLNREEAKELIHCLLTYTDVKFGINDEAYTETSTTIIIGGCNRDGNVVFNDVTKIILEDYT